MTIEQRYDQVYLPLLREFHTRIRDVRGRNLPDIHLPAYGSSYTGAKHKIVVVGMETRGWGKLREGFILPFPSKSSQILADHRGALDRFDPIDSTSGRSGTFWNFNLRFLANVHGLDWQTLNDYKNATREGAQVPRDLRLERTLRGFAWANANSYELNRSDLKEWDQVKTASSLFDSAKYLVEALLPDLIVVLWWGSETWLTTDFPKAVGRKQYAYTHLWHYEVRAPRHFHVIWTAHPQYLARATGRFDIHLEGVSLLARKLLRV